MRTELCERSRGPFHGYDGKNQPFAEPPHRRAPDPLPGARGAHLAGRRGAFGGTEPSPRGGEPEPRFPDRQGRGDRRRPGRPPRFRRPREAGYDCHLAGVRRREGEGRESGREGRRAAGIGGVEPEGQRRTDRGMTMPVLDATDQVLGRFASIVAKRLLKGEEIDVVNAEKALVTGGRAAL